MDNSESNKTSDEIINELFCSLNVPLSPKVVEVEERVTIASKTEQLSVHTGDSDNSEDDESDSKSSESEGETKAAAGGGEVQGNRAEKLKLQKKKKDKRKKKKKHRKKEDGGRHKHKKKKKKENFETAEEAKLAGDILQDVKLKNQAVIQKIMIREEVTAGALEDGELEERKSRSKSPKALETQSEVDRVDNKKMLEQESQNPCEEVLASHREGAAALPVASCEGGDSFSSGATKSDIQPCPTDETSPGAESVNRSSSQVSPTATGEHKRKHSPHSCSPPPVKKQKASNSVSPPGSSSPKGACRLASPSSTERSRSQSVKDTKSCRRTKSRSPILKPSAESDRPGSRSSKRSESKKRSGSRRRSTSRSRKKLDSELMKRSRSRSKKRSRSRSRKSRSRSRRSRSRSRRRSRSRSRRKARSRSKSRRGSKSWRRSRSRSKSKSRRRSRSKSSKRSASKSGRKSASTSNRSKSRERSRSRSRRMSGLRGIRSRSGSRSQSRQRSSSKGGKRSRSRLRRRSRSRSKSRRSRSRGSQSYGRSRSRSSHKSSPAKERFDMFAVMRERASRLAELKNQSIPDGSLGSLLLSAAASVQSGSGSVPQSLATSDPSSIPLPQKGVLHSDSPPKDEPAVESIATVEEEKAGSVTEEAVTVLSPEQEASKARDGSKSKQDEGNEKGKMKTIITIKSLKDSLVFQQAQEEAERKAKEKVDEPAAGSEGSSTPDSKRYHKQGSTERHHQDEAESDEATSLEGKEEYQDREDRAESEENIKKYKKKEKDKGNEKKEGKQGEEKHKGEHCLKETHLETDNFKQQVETEDRDTEKHTNTEKTKPNTEDTDTDTKNTSRKMTTAKTGEREEEKGSKHSSKTEREESKGSKQSGRVKDGEEQDGSEVCSDLEGEDKGSKQSSKSEEDNDKKMKHSSKTDKVEESKINKLVNEVEEEKEEEEEEEGEDRANKQCSRAEGKEERVIANEEERGNKQPTKTEEKEEGKLSKLLNKMEEDKGKGSKSSSKAEEREGGTKSKHSSKSEDKEDSKGSKDLSGKNGHPLPEEDPADKIEEGEITSDKEEEETKPPSKTHSKKSKKDKYSGKEKKRSHKDKSKNKEEKKKAHDKKKEQEKARSKDTHKSRQHSSSSGGKEHSHSRRHRKHSHSRSRTRSRSRSRDHSSRQHRRSHSRSRSKSRSKRRRESTSDLRDKVTRKRLLEIARRNAVYLMQNGCLPPSVEKEQLVKIKAGGKSVDELTDFCKQLVASGNYSDVDVSEPSMSSEEENSSEKPFSSARHPFSVRDSKPILMNIRNAPMLPTKTNAERLAGQAKLREQFPVSSGSQHRTKESEWVPVTPKEKKEEDKVFTKPEAPSVDISQIVSTRLSAMRKLQDNPNDSEAIKTLNNVQKEMQNWALSKQEPGQFTGTTGVKVLSQEELSSGHQAWARKEQFKEAAPVRPHFGLKMLQKMGWSPGEGLGKNKEGTTEPLLLDVKMDKKGFHAQEEVTPKKQPIPLVKDLSGKHPVSALVELCSKRKWSPPDFEMVFDCGPDHKKNFLMKVMVNGQEFKPSVAASTKKMAKANAAAAYLQSLGLYPKDPRYPL